MDPGVSVQDQIEGGGNAGGTLDLSDIRYDAATDTVIVDYEPIGRRKPAGANPRLSRTKRGEINGFALYEQPGIYDPPQTVPMVHLRGESESGQTWAQLTATNMDQNTYGETGIEITNARQSSTRPTDLFDGDRLAGIGIAVYSGPVCWFRPPHRPV